MNQRRRLWLAGLVVLGALGFLVFQGLGNATVYFRTADEAVAQRDALGTRRFRIEGAVVPDTISETRAGVAFRIANNGVEVPVVHEGDPPQMFQAGIPVVLEGRFGGAETFESDRIMVKHSEEYVADHPDRVASTVPTPSQ